MRQAQAAAWAALEDGASLVEVEFPTASLASVAGDAEGEGCGQVQCKAPVPLAPGLPTQPCGLLGCSPTSPGLTFLRTATFPALPAGANEMTYSLRYLRQFMRAFKEGASATRIFFPDQKAGAENLPFVRLQPGVAPAAQRRPSAPLCCCAAQCLPLGRSACCPTPCLAPGCDAALRRACPSPAVCPRAGAPGGAAL